MVAGPEVKLINISRGGALIESEARLSPGANICLRLVTAESVYLLKGQVVRSRASILVGAALLYQSAVSFEEALTILPPTDREEGAVEPDSHEPKLPVAADCRPGESFVSGLISSDEDNEAVEIVTVTADFPDDDCELREILGINKW